MHVLLKVSTQGLRLEVTVGFVMSFTLRISGYGTHICQASSFPSKAKRRRLYKAPSGDPRIWSGGWCERNLGFDKHDRFGPRTSKFLQKGVFADKMMATTRNQYYNQLENSLRGFVNYLAWEWLKFLSESIFWPSSSPANGGNYRSEHPHNMTNSKSSWMLQTSLHSFKVHTSSLEKISRLKFWWQRWRRKL